MSSPFKCKHFNAFSLVMLPIFTVLCDFMIKLEKFIDFGQLTGKTKTGANRESKEETQRVYESWQKPLRAQRASAETNAHSAPMPSLF